jgi:hypothetical protein
MKITIDTTEFSADFIEKIRATESGKAADYLEQLLYEGYSQLGGGFTVPGPTCGRPAIERLREICDLLHRLAFKEALK